MDPRLLNIPLPVSNSQVVPVIWLRSSELPIGDLTIYFKNWNFFQVKICGAPKWKRSAFELASAAPGRLVVVLGIQVVVWVHRLAAQLNNFSMMSCYLMWFEKEEF